MSEALSNSIDVLVTQMANKLLGNEDLQQQLDDDAAKENPEDKLDYEDPTQKAKREARGKDRKVPTEEISASIEDNLEKARRVRQNMDLYIRLTIYQILTDEGLIERD